MSRRKPLSTIVADSLAAQIASGALPPGAKLPTEVELCAQHNVSRTVVREAVARLRSAGQVIPQQGRGVFVSEAPMAPGFLIPEEMLQTLPETIALLELRLSVEVEAAGLCARRRTDAEVHEIRDLMEQVDALQADPAKVQIHYDYDFHLKIATCARNELMVAFLEYLRPRIVPRFQLGHIVTAERKDLYYQRIHTEHRQIVDAIAAQKPRKAREAMRAHLVNSLERLRALASATGTENAPLSPAIAALFTVHPTPPDP